MPPYVSSDHPLCYICSARLFHSHHLSPKVKANVCGHMYCAPCIALHLAHHKDQGCPRCGKAFPQACDNGAPEDALQDIYVNTKGDRTDDWIRRAERECSDTAVAKRLLQEQKALLATAESTSTLLTQNILQNRTTLSSLEDCLAAAQDDERRAEANVERLGEELASLRRALHGPIGNEESPGGCAVTLAACL